MIRLIDKIIDYLSRYFPIFKKLRKLSKYLFFSVLATLSDIIVLYLLTDILGIYYLVSATFSYIVGMFIAFFGNLKYTFEKNHKKKVSIQFINFTIISLIGLGLNIVFMKFFTDSLGVWYMLSKIITVGLIFFIKYFMHKRIVFE